MKGICGDRRKRKPQSKKVSGSWCCSFAALLIKYRTSARIVDPSRFSIPIHEFWGASLPSAYHRKKATSEWSSSARYFLKCSFCFKSSRQPFEDFTDSTNTGRRALRCSRITREIPWNLLSYNQLTQTLERRRYPHIASIQIDSAKTLAWSPTQG